MLALKRYGFKGMSAQRSCWGDVAPSGLCGRGAPVSIEDCSRGLIIPIGIWVLETACKQNVARQRQGLPRVCMSVNLSLRQFSDDNLSKEVAAVLRRTGMDPALLELEITESMIAGGRRIEAKESHEPGSAITRIGESVWLKTENAFTGFVRSGP